MSLSFSDLMSSGRGPGVIGMVLALVVLLGFGVLFIFAFDEGMQGGGQTIESVIAHQAKDIEGYQRQIELGNKKLATAPGLIALSRELAGYKRQIHTSNERLASLAQSLEMAKSNLAALERSFEDYKNAYRAYARDKSKGETLAVLETRNGEVYRNVNIREVTPVGIQIRHDEGQKRIPFEDLPDSMIDYYQFDPRQKSAALAAEAATRSHHEAQAAAANTLADQALAQQREKEQAERRERIAREIASKESQVASLKEEIKQLERDIERAAADAAAARAAGRMHINKSGSISGNIRAKQSRIGTIQGEISQLQSSLDR